MYHYTEVKTDTETLRNCATLLRVVFPQAAQYSVDYLDWQYARNPVGHVVGFNAMSEMGELAGHYVCQPITAHINGGEARGLLSLNTATHPAHQGKGLFTSLAERTFELAARLGYEFVIGVANAKSTPGFTRKLGFNLVTPLDAKIGLGPLPRARWNGKVQFERKWTAETLTWRIDNPCAHYAIDHDTVFANTGKPLVSAVLTRSPLIGQVATQRGHASPVRLWIGRDPELTWKGVAYTDLPTRFRVSPLNLIFKDLSGRSGTLDAAAVRFSLVDFDAY